MSEQDVTPNQTGQTGLLGQVTGLDDQYYMNVYGRRQPLCVVSGEGAWLTGSDGKRYLDLIGGIAVSVLGHAHPRLVQAICEQAGRVIHCSNYFYNEPQARLAERLAVLSGLDGARVFIGNSGAEANEAAIKLARAYFHHQGAPRARIVSALKSFHGRTLATATATGQDKYSAPFAPLPTGFVHVPYNDIAALEQAVDQNTCAVLLEVIQGESGVIMADPVYLKTAEALCRQTGARLIIDEIQTGMGRTGRFLAYEHAGLRPDIVTLAKGLAGGVPIGAMIANEETAAGFKPGDHGTTFGGNPLACAAALAVLDTYAQDQLVERAASVGAALKRQLLDLAERQPAIAEVRGLGLMLGIGLNVPGAQAVKASLLKQGFLVGSVGDTTIRLLPPLIVASADLSLFVRAFGETIAELAH
ncbi:MAG: acetylornithine transaminase [Clostridiaceae bacterium]|nr:acetylornithine transaminase [Clostridiaceae bacterium]